MLVKNIDFSLTWKITSFLMYGEDIWIIKVMLVLIPFQIEFIHYYTLSHMKQIPRWHVIISSYRNGKDKYIPD
jgi:hypothetical protein